MRLPAKFENIADLRTDLEAVADGLGRALAAGIEEDAAPLLAEAKTLTPYGPGPRPGADPDSDSALPHISDSLYLEVRGGTIALVATHPGAIVHEYGGTIAPRGQPIQIKRSAMARRAAVQVLPDIEKAVEERIDRLTRQHLG